MCFSRAVIISVPLTTSLAILSSIIYFISQGSCPEGHFSCEGNDKCIKQRNICDGHFDCPSGDDEHPLYCADLHGAFWGLVDNLRYKPPNETCVLDEVPMNCTCTEYTVIVCFRQSLTHVPSGIPKLTTRLVLAENYISLEESDFFGFRLQLIHLGNNNITILPENIFAGQVQLEKLFLFENHLSVLPTGVFRDLTKLSWLFLHSNELKELNFENWDLQELFWLDLSNNSLTLKHKSFPKLNSLSILYLELNHIEEITQDTFSNLTALIDLSIGWNRIQKIHPLAFKNVNDLQELNLRNNELMYLSEDIFSYTRNLTKLNLGGNIFLKIGHQLFFPLLHLKSLDLQDIDIVNIDVKMFSILQNLDFVYFKRFKYCTYAPHVPKCFPYSDGHSSTLNLMDQEFHRLTLWLVATFTLIANGLVLWNRLTSPSYTSPLNLLITNLAVSDLLMGIYLIIIGSQDLLLKGNYIANARKWMSSGLCTCAGVIGMLSSEVSMLMILLISAERYLLIAAPLGKQKSLKPKVAILSVSSVWIFALIISLLPVVQWRGAKTFYGSNTFCFPLYMEDPFIIGWQYSAFVFLGINSFGIIGIALLYVGVFLSIYKTRHATTLNVKDSEFAFKFCFIVLTNACCWVPVVIFKIMAFLDISLSGELYGWLAVFVLPINSAVNPILYTFSIPQHRATIRPGEPSEGDKTIMKRRFSKTQPLNNKEGTSYERPKTSEEQI